MNLTGNAWLTLADGTVLPLYIKTNAIQIYNDSIDVTCLGSPHPKILRGFRRITLNLDAEILGEAELSNIPIHRPNLKVRYESFIREVTY